MAMKLKEYRLVRDEFMSEHPKCQICGKESTDLHHKAGRIGRNLTDVNTFMALTGKWVVNLSVTTLVNSRVFI